MKIAYIELDTHAELAANFYKLSQYFTKVETDFYFSEKIFARLDISESKNIRIVTPKNILDKIKPENYQLIIIGTAHRYFNIFNSLAKMYRTAVIVHNKNFAAAQASTLFKNIMKKDVVYRLKLLFKEALLSAPAFYRNAKHLVLEKNLIDRNEMFFPLLFAFEDIINSGREDISKLNIVVPGNVTNHRRNYDHIFKSILNFKKTANVFLLGKADGEMVKKIQNVQGNVPDHIQLIYFTDRVAADEFNQIMSAADVLWCPIQRKTEFFSIAEIYGKTKMTGNIGDAIQYSKPAVFPAEYTSEFPFIQREQTNVEKQLWTLASGKFDFSGFSITTVAKQCEQVILQLI